MEDAVVIGRCLDMSDAPAALRRYEKAGLQRTTAIVQGYSGNTKRFHNPAFGNPEGVAASRRMTASLDNVTPPLACKSD